MVDGGTRVLRLPSGQGFRTDGERKQGDAWVTEVWFAVSSWSAGNSPLGPLAAAAALVLGWVA